MMLLVVMSAGHLAGEELRIQADLRLLQWRQGTSWRSWPRRPVLLWLGRLPKVPWEMPAWESHQGQIKVKLFA